MCPGLLVDEAGLTAASSKLGKTATLGCALQGSAANFMHTSPTHVGMVRSGPRNLLPTHVGMDQHPARCRKTCSVFPTHVGIPSLGVL